MSNKYWLLLLLILIVPSVLADDIRFTGKQHDNITVLEYCYDANGYCNASTTCNITIGDSQNVLIDNQQMSNNGSFFSYFLNSNLTANQGIYQSSVVCQNSGLSANDNFFVKITPSGYEISVPEAVMYCIYIAIFLVLFLVSLVCAILMNGKNKYDFGGQVEINYGKYLRMFLFIVSYLCLWITIFFSSEIISKFFGMATISSFLYSIFKTMGYLLIGILPILFFVCIADWLSDLKIMKEQKRNLPPR